MRVWLNNFSQFSETEGEIRVLTWFQKALGTCLMTLDSFFFFSFWPWILLRVTYTLLNVLLLLWSLDFSFCFEVSISHLGDFSNLQHVICLAFHYHLIAEMYFMFGSTPWLFLGWKSMQSQFFRHFQYSLDLAFFSKIKTRSWYSVLG